MTFCLSSDRLVLATQNPDKLKEIQEIMKGCPIRLVSLLDYPDVKEVVENGDTLLDNAIIKAKAAYALTGLPSIADDTGLEVDALNGAPGVYSSRYAGESATYAQNVIKLLKSMKDVPEAERTARFRCVVALVDGENTHWVDGVCEGSILNEPRGDSGFGYDPVFDVPEFGKTFAEMTADEKHAVSHRGKAFRKMKERLIGA